jgi:hypothetical protein
MPAWRHLVKRTALNCTVHFTTPASNVDPAMKTCLPVTVNNHMS